LNRTKLPKRRSKQRYNHT